MDASVYTYSSLAQVSSEPFVPRKTEVTISARPSVFRVCGVFKSHPTAFVYARLSEDSRSKGSGYTLQRCRSDEKPIARQGILLNDVFEEEDMGTLGLQMVKVYMEELGTKADTELLELPYGITQWKTTDLTAILCAKPKSLFEHLPQRGETNDERWDNLKNSTYDGHVPYTHLAWHKPGTDEEERCKKAAKEFNKVYELQGTPYKVS